MGDVATAMRDPVFYRWHAFIDNILQRFKATLPRYTEDKVRLVFVSKHSISEKVFLMFLAQLSGSYRYWRPNQNRQRRQYSEHVLSKIRRQHRQGSGFPGARWCLCQSDSSSAPKFQLPDSRAEWFWFGSGGDLQDFLGSQIRRKGKPLELPRTEDLVHWNG